MTSDRETARRAGWRALDSLNEVKNELDSARFWGIVDMFGGRGISTFLKHSKLNRASTLILAASSDLKAFQIEVREVLPLTDLQPDIGGLLTFLDFFADDFIFDYLVQRRINEARDKVDQAIGSVTRLINALEP